MGVLDDQSNLSEPLINNDGSLLSDDTDCVRVERGSRLGVEHDQPRKTPHAKVLRRWFHSLVLERQRQPRHLAQVFIVQVLVLVARQKHDFHHFLRLVDVVVKFDEKRSELATGRAIVHRKVEHHDFVLRVQTLPHRGLSSSHFGSSV